MFDSFDIDTEDYSDVLAHDDDCKIQAKNIVEQANCQVMKNRAAQAIRDRHSGRKSTFDIIKNWANRAVIDLDSIKPGYESLEADNLICIRAEDKDIYSKNNSIGFYGRLDYKGTKDPIVRHVLLENERELVWEFGLGKEAIYDINKNLEEWIRKEGILQLNHFNNDRETGT